LRTPGKKTDRGSHELLLKTPDKKEDRGKEERKKNK